MGKSHTTHRQRQNRGAHRAQDSHRQDIHNAALLPPFRSPGRTSRLTSKVCGALGFKEGFCRSIGVIHSKSVRFGVPHSDNAISINLSWAPCGLGALEKLPGLLGIVLHGPRRKISPMVPEVPGESAWVPPHVHSLQSPWLPSQLQASQHHRGWGFLIQPLGTMPRRVHRA